MEETTDTNEFQEEEIINNINTYTYDEAIDKTGFGFFQFFLLFVCGAG
jgi:hypothetical protein